jgi:hypothetical protein
MKTDKTGLAPVIASLMVLALACAHVPTKDPSARLEKRVSGYWEARKTKDLVKAYDFYARDYKSEISKTDFIKGANIEILAFQIAGIRLSEDQTKAEVSVLYDAMILGYRMRGIKTEDEWIYENNDWYFSSKGGGFKDLFKK